MADHPLEPHLYVWNANEGKPFSSDPAVQPPDLLCFAPATRPDIYLDGECVNGRVLWCVTGNPGMIDLYDKQDGRHIIDPETRHAKHTLHRGHVVVVPVGQRTPGATP